MMEIKITRTKKLFVVFVMMIAIRASYELETSSSLIRKLEKSLFSKLGMKNRPVVDRKKIRIPPAMMGLYHKQMNHEYESTALPLPGRLTRSANTARSYTHQESSIDNRFVHSHRFRLNFNLTGFPTENEMVTSTELRLTIVPKESRSLDCSHQRVNVYDIVKPGIKGQTKPILRIVDTAVVNTTGDAISSLSLDVLPIIERWLSDPSSNHGMLIDVRSPTGDTVSLSHVRLKRSLQEKDEERWETLQPLLLLYSADTAAAEKLATATPDWNDLKRRKRSTSTRKRVRDECRRKQLWVDFEKVGWNDWIVAPPGYDAYFCDGECPTQFGDHLNTTNHAIVQSLVHSVHPQTIPKPCCVPTTLTSISMLYLDEHSKAVLKNYPDMVVEGCGCR